MYCQAHNIEFLLRCILWKIAYLSRKALFILVRLLTVYTIIAHYIKKQNGWEINVLLRCDIDLKLNNRREFTVNFLSRRIKFVFLPFDNLSTRPFPIVHWIAFHYYDKTLPQDDIVVWCLIIWL